MVRLLVCVLLIATALATFQAGAQSFDIRSAQQRLMELGYDPGPIDGAMGTRTRRAISAFQSRSGLSATGQLDAQTMRALAPRPPSATVPARSQIVQSQASGGTRSDGSSIWWWIIGGGLAMFLFGSRKGRAAKASNKPAPGADQPRSRRAAPTETPEQDVHIEVSVTPFFSRSLTNAQSGDRYWVPAEKPTMVAGLDIGGMVYVGRGLRAQGSSRPENCLIDPSLTVAKQKADIAGEQLSYWPSYADLSPRSRLAYLQWLASGRKDPAYEIGYVFLYFYGLERRLFGDKPSPEERAALIAEVERLRAIYAGNRSFDRYSQALLEAAPLLAPGNYSPAPVYESSSFEIPLPVRIGIGKRIANAQPIDAPWLLSWWITHPDTRPRTPARRAFPEFTHLFQLRFAQQFSDGLRVVAPKRSLSATYRAASGSFERSFAQELAAYPDISKLTKPVSVAQQIAESCTNDLEAFSRYLGRNPNGRNTLEGHAVLPAELADLLPNAEIQDLRRWAEEQIDRQNGLVLVESLLGRLEGKTTDRLSRRSLAGAAAALSRVSIGLAPDPEFAFRLPKLGEPVQLFRLEDGAKEMNAPSAGYMSALLSTTLGTFIAQADGTVSDVERERLKAHVAGSANLTAAEKARLNGNIDWMAAVPPSLAPLRKRFEGLTETHKHELGQLAIAVAGSNGVVAPAEIKAVQKLYKALGLAEEGIYSDLHALADGVAATEPVTVRPASSVPEGFAVPPPPAAGASAGAQVIRLDQQRVSAIMADTAKVSTVLGSIFGDDEPEEIDAAETQAATIDSSLLKGLDPSHRAFVAELLTRESWSAADFAQLAKHFGLMAEGARETINEWAFEQFDSPLIDEDVELEISPEIAGLLKPELEGATSVAA